MVSRAQKVRLGIFIAVSSFILIVAIAIVTGNKLTSRTSTYFIRYTDLSLAGLEIGSPVKYRGIRIGRIEDIFIDPDDVKSVIVKVSVKPDVPIKEDTEAVVVYISLAAGLKMIELQGGTNESNKLTPESYIKAGQTFADQISDKAEAMTQKIELILNNLAKLTEVSNQQQLFRLVENTSKVLENVNTLLDTNQNNFQASIQNITHFTNSLDTFMTVANVAMANIQEVTQSRQWMNTVNNIDKISTDLADANLGQVINQLADAIEQTNRTFTHLDLTLLKSRHDILSSTEILRESLEYFNEFTRLISENPSLLLRSSPQEEIEER
ncbi:MCE family protein [candidate division KSB1 bacterium]|nr:MCE family protein [candidate division KSB1 bacterium]